MNIKHLNYVVTIAQERYITKAAEKLFISQSSLSYALSSIEKEVGQPLFYRQKNGVIITQAGEKYVEAAQKILHIQDELMKELKILQSNTYIRVASSSIWGTSLIEEIIPKFRRKHPDAYFELKGQAELFYLNAEIAKGNLDFCFLSLSSFDRLDTNMQILKKEPLFFAVPSNHPYCRQNLSPMIPATDIATCFSSDTFLLSRPGSSIRKIADHIFSVLDFAPAHIFEVNGLRLTCGMVAEEEGPAFIPESARFENDRIRYYSMDPVYSRYNVLMHKPLNNCNETEQSFYRYVMNLFVL